jgi:meso-butanediol dehydrogenase / (S,S)-butanediol dehydrogenase / diacetyl reductase
MRLKEKVAIIIGAGRGIGKTIATAFARNGADILAVDVNFASAEETADEIKAMGWRALAVKADISKWDEVEKWQKQLFWS